MQQWDRLDALMFMPEASSSEPGGLIAWDIDPHFEYVHLREFHLQPNYQHQGHGRAILSAWIGQCRLLGVQGMRLKVFSENPAMALYARMGFVPMEEDGEIDRLIDMHRLF